MVKKFALSALCTSLFVFSSCSKDGSSVDDYIGTYELADKPTETKTFEIIQGSSKDKATISYYYSYPVWSSSGGAPSTAYKKRVLVDGATVTETALKISYKDPEENDFTGTITKKDAKTLNVNITSNATYGSTISTTATKK